MASNKPQHISDEEKLAKAKTYKEQGNECHKTKDFRGAIGKYHRALLQLKAIGQTKSSGLGALLSEDDLSAMGYSTKVSPEMQADVAKIMADCYNNLAACLLQSEDTNYEKVIQYCDQVAALTPQNIKAYYRRGLGYYNLGNYDKALESFMQAESIAKNTKDQNFKALLSRQMTLCREGIREQDKKLKEAYKGMFGKTSSKDPGDNG